MTNDTVLGRRVTDSQSTHGQDCWGWGPRHYECAVREIKALRMEAALLRVDRDSWEQRALRAEARVAVAEWARHQRPVSEQGADAALLDGDKA